MASLSEKKYAPRLKMAANASAVIAEPPYAWTTITNKMLMKASRPTVLTLFMRARLSPSGENRHKAAVCTRCMNFPRNRPRSAFGV
jgi:hypothetical protein